MRLIRLMFLLLLVQSCCTCTREKPDEGITENADPKVLYALVIHGGAGVMNRNDAAKHSQAAQSLARALQRGQKLLQQGKSSLDVVELVVKQLEDDPLFNAGRGAVFDAKGEHELDASIMDGKNLQLGAVAGVRTVKNPIALARVVMEQTKHVLLFGEGAEQLAHEAGLTLVTNDYFSTPQRRASWKQVQSSAKEGGSTVGAVALDQQGNLAAATSTGGLTNKRYGRVGDSPIAGAGTYADNRTCGISATGKGEEFIRHAVARMIAAYMQLGHKSLQQAAQILIHQTLKPGDGGIIGVSKQGQIVMEYNTQGMYRAACDSTGRFEVLVWDKPQKL